jgi:hypothetical protein
MSRKWMLVLPMILLAAGAGHAQQQKPTSGSALGISLTHVRFSGDMDYSGLRSITGPTASFSWWGRIPLGVDLAATYLPRSGPQDMTGGIADLGAALGIPSGRSALLLRGGVSGTAGTNNSGGYMLGGGVYGGAGALVRVASRLALRADVTARTNEVYPDAPAAVSFGVGLTLVP